MKQYNKRIDDLELNTCNKNLLSSGKQERMEICQWFAKTTRKVVIAYWSIPTDEGVDLKFVGSRPFNVDKKIFWKLAKIGQKKMEKESKKLYE